jgi:hypothetical protein
MGENAAYFCVCGTAERNTTISLTVVTQLHENCCKLYCRKCYCVYVCTLMHVHACGDVHLYYFLNYQ